MVRLDILDMRAFLQVIDRCKGAVWLLLGDGRRVALPRQPQLYQSLRQRHSENGGILPLTLRIDDPGDYMRIISYYAGDC